MKKERTVEEQNLYSRWSGIKRRCLNKNSPAYKNYGGRGIKICDEWKNSFESFCSWAITNGYKKELSIDRIDVDGNYEPSNCRWATLKEQNNNKRTNINLTYNGESHSLIEWSYILGICKATLSSRLCRGWSTEKTLSTPLNLNYKKTCKSGGEGEYTYERPKEN